MYIGIVYTSRFGWKMLAIIWRPYNPCVTFASFLTTAKATSEGRIVLLMPLVWCKLLVVINQELGSPRLLMRVLSLSIALWASEMNKRWCSKIVTMVLGGCCQRKGVRLDNTTFMLHPTKSTQQGSRTEQSFSGTPMSHKRDQRNHHLTRRQSIVLQDLYLIAGWLG